MKTTHGPLQYVDYLKDRWQICALFGGKYCTLFDKPRGHPSKHFGSLSLFKHHDEAPSILH
jgi:hypothetical protein